MGNDDTEVCNKGAVKKGTQANGEEVYTKQSGVKETSEW